MEKIFVPDLGGFENIEIIELFVSEGDTVQKETSLFSLESDKAVMDIPSPFSGVIKNLMISAGDKVSQGDLIGEIEVDENSKNSVVPETEKSDEKAFSLLPETDDAVPTQEVIKKHEIARKSDTEKFQKPGAVYHASPSVRQYARDLEINLEGIEGTGPKGRITKNDLKNFIKAGLSNTAATGIFPSVPTEDYSAFGPIEEINLSRIKRITGERLTASWLTIPHVTQFDEADITDLEIFRNDQSMSILPFIMKATAAALKKFPFFNSSLGSAGETLIIKDYINIGIAVDTEKGLVVPVITEVDKKNITLIAKELKDKGILARKGRLKPEDFYGGSFTISSLGGIGGTGFTPIVNAPQAAILGVSKAVMKPVWNGSEFNPALILPFSVSYDHRIIDGAEAARFTRYLSSLLEDIRRVLL